MTPNSSPTIRAMRDEDEQQIVGLWRACGLVTPWNDPARDLALARGKDTSDVLVAEDDDKLSGTIMIGHDGHRGWVYYLAVDPAASGQGIGQALMQAAEDWLRAKHIPKMQLMIRPTNLGVKRFYLRGGYKPNPCHIMQKWLEPTNQPQIEGANERGQLAVTITHLEMTAPPSPVPHPSTGRKLALLRAEAPSVGFYRYLYDTVGKPWLWYERRLKSDEEIAAVLADDKVEVFTLYVDGVPGGFFELNFKDPNDAELAYFGLMPDFVGQGLGPWFLHEALTLLWSKGHTRVITNTCTLDHPRALVNYQRLGFVPYAQEEKLVDDPRLLGLISP